MPPAAKLPDANKKRAYLAVAPDDADKVERRGRKSAREDGGQGPSGGARNVQFRRDSQPVGAVEVVVDDDESEHGESPDQERSRSRTREMQPLPVDSSLPNRTKRAQASTAVEDRVGQRGRAHRNNQATSPQSRAQPGAPETRAQLRTPDRPYKLSPEHEMAWSKGKSPLPSQEAFAGMDSTEQLGILEECLVNQIGTAANVDEAQAIANDMISKAPSLTMLHQLISDEQDVNKVHDMLGAMTGTRRQLDFDMSSNVVAEGAFVEFGHDQNGEPMIGRVQTVEEEGAATKVTAALWHKGETVDATRLLRSKGRIERAPRNDGWCARHPAAKAVKGNSGQRFFAFRKHGGEQAAYAKAERQLHEWESLFAEIADKKQLAKLCLCPSKPCPFAKRQDPGILHCPGYTLVPRDSIEHQFLFEAMEVQGEPIARASVNASLAQIAAENRSSAPMEHAAGTTGEAAAVQQ